MQGEDSLRLPPHGARRVPCARRPVRQQPDEPEQGSKATVLQDAGFFGERQVEVVQERIRGQARVEPHGQVLDHDSEFEGPLAGAGVLEIHDPDAGAVPQEVRQTGIALAEHEIGVVPLVSAEGGGARVEPGGGGLVRAADHGMKAGRGTSREHSVDLGGETRDVREKVRAALRRRFRGPEVPQRPGQGPGLPG